MLTKNTQAVLLKVRARRRWWQAYLYCITFFGIHTAGNRIFCLCRFVPFMFWTFNFIDSAVAVDILFSCSPSSLFIFCFRRLWPFFWFVKSKCLDFRHSRICQSQQYPDQFFRSFLHFLSNLIVFSNPWIGPYPMTKDPLSNLQSSDSNRLSLI